MYDNTPTAVMDNGLMNPADERIHHGFGHFGGFGRPGFGFGRPFGFGFGRPFGFGFGRPFGFGFGRPFGYGLGFGLPFLGGLAAGALLTAPFAYGYGYPFYGYPYFGYPYYGYPYFI